jgi:hypothetical protein
LKSDVAFDVNTLAEIDTSIFDEIGSLPFEEASQHRIKRDLTVGKRETISLTLNFKGYEFSETS